MGNGRSTPEEEQRFAHYEASAEQMRKLHVLFRRSLWWNLANVAVLITITIVTVGLISAGRADNLNLPAHDTGSQLFAAVLFQIFALIFCVTVCVLSVLAATKHRLSAIVLTGLYGAMCMYQFAVGMPVRNILYPICFVSGFLLNLRLIRGFRQLDRLSQLPGYPQFVRRLDESSKYELPLYLQDRKQAQDMEDLTPATPAVSVPDASSDMPSVPAMPDMEPLPQPDAPIVPDIPPVTKPDIPTVPKPTAPVILPGTPSLSESISPASLKPRTAEELFGAPIFTSEQIYTAPEDHQEEH